MMMVVWMPDDDASQGQADVWCFAVSGQWQSFFWIFSHFKKASSWCFAVSGQWQSFVGFAVILKKQFHGVLLSLASGNPA